MSDWTGVIRQAAVQDNVVIQHYIKGLIPCQIAEKTGFPASSWSRPSAET